MNWLEYLILYNFFVNSIIIFKYIMTPYVDTPEYLNKKILDLEHKVNSNEKDYKLLNPAVESLMLQVDKNKGIIREVTDYVYKDSNN